MKGIYWQSIAVMCFLWVGCGDAGFTCADGQTVKGGRCVDNISCDTPCKRFSTCKNTTGGFECVCNTGFFDDKKRDCKDYDECKNYADMCGLNSDCHNTQGSFYCRCHSGFARSDSQTNFTGYGKGCEDVNECLTNACGSNTVCTNSEGSYNCTCHEGYVLSSHPDQHQTCVEFVCDSMESPECNSSTVEGPGAESDYCSIMASLTKRDPCRNRLNVESFDIDQNLEYVTEFTNQLHGNRSLMGRVESRDRAKLLKISLRAVEKLVTAIASNLPPLDKRTLNLNNIEIEMQALQQDNWTEGSQASASLSARGNQMDMNLRGVSRGNDTGTVEVAFIAHPRMDSLVNGSFREIEEERERERERGGEKDQGLRLISDVVTVAITKRNQRILSTPINITFLNREEAVEGARIVCIALNRTVNNWSTQGCSLVRSNGTHTVCSCAHLSSFAVLMSLHEIQDPWHLFNLSIISYVGLILSMGCLVIAILTFLCCRAIRSTRTTIHAHLCLNLFLAQLLFTVGISQIRNELVCALIAGFLHYFFLTVFAWMLLEGVQLYIMVVKIFNNNTLTKRHILPIGYLLPLSIVGISAAINSEGYGTEKHCWLSREKNFLWSFLGPVCAIILINFIFFSITLHKLARKMSTLQRNKPKVKKLRLFTGTAFAQLCVLGCTWIFGIFNLNKDTIVMAYIFTSINSLQGFFIFILHCLLNKQVREQYRRWSVTLCGLRAVQTEFNTSLMPMSLQEKSSFSTVTAI